MCATLGISYSLLYYYCNIKLKLRCYACNRRPFDQLVRFPNPLAIETFISVGDLARDLVASSKIRKVIHEYNVNIKALVQACPSPAQCYVIVFANIDTNTNIDEDIHTKLSVTTSA